MGILQEGIYYSKRDSRKHYCVVAKGYPISESILNELKELDCKKICITEQTVKAKKIWVCDFEKYQNTKAFQLGGFDWQKCCPLSEMTLHKEIKN